MEFVTASLLTPGTLLDGRYRIERLLGEGGMGAVYLARQVAVDRPVAVKILKPEAADHPGAVARFREEMQVTSRMEHPNTIRLYDFGETAGRLYLVMEYLGGKTLRQMVAFEGRQPVARVLHLGRQIALGLGAAHEMGVVHRDLKPDNVMLVDLYGAGDLVKVVDFGIARSLDELRPQLTQTGQVIGTPAYMAPEQASGEALDHRTDLYALGVILYELLAGTVPFQRNSMMSMLMAHASAAPPPLEPQVPGLPDRASRLVMRLLAKSPDARAQSAAEVVEEIDACAAEAGLKLGGGPPVATGGRGSGRITRGGGGGTPEPIISAPQSGRTAVLPETTGRSVKTATAQQEREQEQEQEQEQQQQPAPPPDLPSRSPPSVAMPRASVVAPALAPPSPSPSPALPRSSSLSPSPTLSPPATASLAVAQPKALATWRWVKPLLVIGLLGAGLVAGAVALLAKLLGGGG